jgi:hypothetical protein
MNLDVKYAYKRSYRINNRIKHIIDRTFKDIRRETGLSLSLGKVSRAFWMSLAADAAFRKKFIDCIHKMSVDEISRKNSKSHCVRPKRDGYFAGKHKKRNALH